MRISACGMENREDSRGKRRSAFIAAALIIAAHVPFFASAEIKVIETDNTYVMGDGDSKVDARRIAVREAQRKALGLAGTYVSSLTQVKNFQLTKDEVTAYTAGVMETEIVSEDLNYPSLTIKVRCTIDTDVLEGQIEQFRGNEELKEQLLASQRESDALRKERDSLLSRLAAEKDRGRIDNTKKKLEAVLSKEETNAEVAKVWAAFFRNMEYRGRTDQAASFDAGEIDKAVLVLDRAVALSPKNQHARVLLGSLHELSSDIGAAEDQFRAAAAANPTSPFVHLKLGLFLDHQGRHAEALKQFLAVERLRPRDPFVLFHIGMTYKSMGQCRQSISNLKRFLKATERKTSRRVAVMKRDAAEIIRECKNRPSGPAGRQRPIRRRR